METLNVALGERSYPIFIGSEGVDQALLAPYIRARQVVVVSNTTVAPLYFERLKDVLPAYDVSSIILPDGEQHKTLEVMDQIYTALLHQRCNRQVTLIALGGGVVGDMCGFAAATYQRGVDFIQLPTTLLAQVDSSVGGKTGVNHALGKNMIGAFYQPQCVVIDTSTLSTLADNQLRAGLAEVIKYGLMQDADFFVWLEQNMAALLNRDEAALMYAIHRSCACKARVVAADEKEAGQRALLNLGHTFGHAIETAMGYGAWLHGEAVAVGMCMAANLSRQQGWLTERAYQRTVALIEAAQLPTQAPREMTVERFLELMSVDKKVMDGQLRLVLLKALGQGVVSHDFSMDLLKETLAAR